MKSVLIIQQELPAYRDFLWQGLRAHMNLYLADVGKNRLILPDCSVTSLDSYEFQHRPDCLVLNAGVREAFKAVLYIIKYRPITLIGWTQFVGKNKGLISRLLKSLYLLSLFDKILIYYDHEKRLMPFDKLANKTVGLNNTIADWAAVSAISSEPKSFLFIGRYTEKSKLLLLLEAASNLSDLNLHIIGAERDEIPAQFHIENIHIHGKITDLKQISEVASSCTYFVYPGDVGLSIVHAVKLGLIPVVHADLDEHMPECRAVAQIFPLVYFQNNDRDSLFNTLKLLSKMKHPSDIKETISSDGLKYFAQNIMIVNFATAVGGI